jgi:putative endonuclease
MKAKRTIGKEFEEKAATFLGSAGYRILDRNVNYKWGEIDLVVLDPMRNDLVFVEVRSRAEDAMVAPEETVGFSKLKRLTRAIDTYLVSDRYREKGLEPAGIRIDLVAFDGDRIAHWVNFV